MCHAKTVKVFSNGYTQPTRHIAVQMVVNEALVMLTLALVPVMYAKMVKMTISVSNELAAAAGLGVI